MVSAKILRQAEARLRMTRRDIAAMPVKDMHQLLHELQVHQIELEMQNEELRRTQLELEVARDRYVDLYEFSPAGHLTMDTHSTIVEANLRAATLFGINRNELVGQSLAHFIASDDQDTFHRHYQDVLKTGMRQTCEVHLRKKAGVCCCVYVESFAVHDESGRITHWLTALLDITERKRAEEVLRESEELLRAIIGNSPTLVFLKDTEGRYLLVNRKFEDSFHIANRDLVGKTDQHIFPPEQAVAFLANDRKVLEAGRAMEFEEVALHDDGPHTSIVVKFPLLNAQGECYALCGIGTDITERAELVAANLNLKLDIADRKQAEAVLRESEERFHTMADTAPVLIWMSGPDKLRTYFNQRWLDYTGRTLEQERGNGWAEGVYPEDLDRCLKTYEEAFDRRESFKMEYRLRKADGQYGWLLAHGVPRFLPNGEFAGYIGSCIDLTLRKDLEDQLRKTVKEKESLLREVHHRVKNNLQVISSLLNLQAASIKNPQVVQLFRECQTRVASIALLHETLHRSNDLSCIRMSNYLRTLASHVFRSYGVDPKAVVLDLLVEDLAFDIDTGMTCGMIVEELLANALKHAYEVGKGGRIQIELQAQAEGAYLLQVSDDGVGISKDGVQRNPASLGLELVNLLVEKLGGTVELQSGPGTAWGIEFHQLHYQERDVKP